MPGVTVTLTSPSQMGTRSAVTDADGSYRFTAVTPGEYVVVFELPGFSTVRNEGIRVGLGFTATVNAALTVASLQESVTVTGQSPVVDTSATQIGNSSMQAAVGATTSRILSRCGRLAGVQMSRIDVAAAPAPSRASGMPSGQCADLRGINAPKAERFGTIPTSAAWRQCISTPPRIALKRRRRA